MPTATRESAPVRSMQGIAVPANAVQPDEFFRRTRRHTQLEKQIAYTGQTTDTIELRKADILSGITLRFQGQIVITGTVNSTARWPYDFFQAIRFTANGASNLINVSGLKLKIREMMKLGDLTDRGVPNIVGGISRVNGTLGMPSESWGVGSNTPTLTPATYAVDLQWYIPIAEDEIQLAGAIFLQTATADLTLAIDYAPLNTLFTGAGTYVLTGATQVITTKFSIPVADGSIVVPDLSTFHSMIQSRTANGLQTGENEIRIIGQGAGKSLLRLSYQLYNGAGTAATPLPMTTANFGVQAWRYGNNEQPDSFIDGTHMRMDEDRRYSSDIGGIWGVGCHDFANQLAFRDVVDLGTTAELRLVINVQNAVSLASPALEYVTETMFLAGQGA